MRQLLAIALFVVAGCGAGAGAPPPDSCLVPSAGSIDTLEIGAASYVDLEGGLTTFAPLHDGDGMALLRGDQGANMLGFILRISGASAPSCLGQTTTVTDTGGARITMSTPPLATYAKPDGTRVTKPLWLPADYPASFVITVDAAGQSLALHLHLLLAK